MNILLFGATGKVGRGVLQECLQDKRVKSVVVVNRRPLAYTHEKLHEIVLADVADIASHADELMEIDGCLYCIGTTNFSQSEEACRKITVDLTMRVARAVHSICPRSVFCYISGAGVGNKQLHFLMPMRVKWNVEQQLLELFGKHTYMLRPGYIHMSSGVPHASGRQKSIYTILLIPLRLLIRQILYPHFATTTKELGVCMIGLAEERPEWQVVECVEMVKLCN